MSWFEAPSEGQAGLGAEVHGWVPGGRGPGQQQFLDQTRKGQPEADGCRAPVRPGHDGHGVLGQDSRQVLGLGGPVWRLPVTVGRQNAEAFLAQGWGDSGQRPEPIGVHTVPQSSSPIAA
ncbi:hypothetical protein AB0L41_23980 [Amycolatopsis mediterranei]|uniref:hypothetical protein n=1 Tax=Amycolatopsis mediterranei TaxID=33910 RepID=UPI00343408F4